MASNPNRRPTKSDNVKVSPDTPSGPLTNELGSSSRGATGKNKMVTNFSQQKLRAWQPVLTPKWIVSVFLGFGTVFIILGVILLLTSNNIIECEILYPDPDSACSDIDACTNKVSLQITKDNCVGPEGGKLKAPVYLYYELSNYYQNHRRYVKSRNDEQLRGAAITDPRDLSSCDPIIRASDGRVLSPCGLVAWSVFNDTFSLEKNGTPIKLNEDGNVIAWSTDINHKFKNPAAANPSEIDEWLNPTIFPGKVQNGHFVVWMRSAALPTFRKLYAKIETDIELPVDVIVLNRYPVSAFAGTKKVVLSTTSWLGGRNSLLGISYLVIGSWCLIFGIFFVVKNYKSPRILGDVRYLKWMGNRQTK